MTTQGKKASWWEITFVCMTTISTNIMVSYLNYINYYLTGSIGVSVLVGSSFITIFRIWDAITDPVVGELIDRTNTRFGKFRPFITIGGLGVLLTSYLMMHLPGYLSAGAKFPVFIVLYMFYVVFATAHGQNMRSIAAVLTTDNKQRATIGMTNGIYASLVFGLFPTLVFSYLVPKYHGFNDAFFHAGWMICAAIFAVSTLLTIIGLKNKDICTTDSNSIKGERQSLKSTILDYMDVIAHSRPLQMIMLSAGTDKLGVTVQGNATVLVILYAIVAGNSRISSSVAAYTLIPNILFIIFGLGGIARKFGSKKIMIWASWGGLVVSVLSCVLWCVADMSQLSYPGLENFNGWNFISIVFLLLWIIIKGFQMISQNAINPLMGDIIDYETYRSGKYMPGKISAIYTLMDKVISSLGVTIVGIMLAAIGFTGELPTIETPYTIPLFVVGLVGMYVITILGLIVNLIAMKFYDLTPERMAEIRVELEKKEKGGVL